MVTIVNGTMKLDARTIGKVENDKLLMHRSRMKHYYRVLNAWCINIDVINSGVTKFIITVDDGDKYIIGLDKIKALRSKLNMFVTFKDERQLAIPHSCWDRYVKENKDFPIATGIPADEFAEKCDGRWRSRLVAYSQRDIEL